MVSLKKYPWIQKLVWTLKNRFTGSVKPYNGRWIMAKEVARRLEKIKKPRNGKKILVFACNALWADYLLFISLLLNSLGYQIVFMYTNEDVENEGVSDFTCWSASFLVPNIEGIEIINLDNIRLDCEIDTSAYSEIIQKVSLNDVRYSTKNEKFGESLAEKKLLDIRIGKNKYFLKKMLVYLQDKKDFTALTGNGSFYEMGTFYYAITQIGIKCMTIDTFELNEGLVVDWEKPSIEWNTKPCYEKFKDVICHEEAANFWHSDFIRRSSSKTGFQIAEIDDKNILESIGINNNYPNILMCGNLVWDSAVLNCERAFDGIEEAFSKTIKWAEGKKVNLILRMHPVEARVDQPVSLEDRLRKKWFSLPKNVIIISSNQKISSYSLFPYVELAIVYTSTIGLELAAFGVPVITCGKTHYANKKFTYDPFNESEYFDLLEKFIERDLSPMTPEAVDLAKVYYFIYFKYFPKALPWKLWSLKDDVKKIEPEQISDPGFKDIYLDTLRYIAGEPCQARGWI